MGKEVDETCLDLGGIDHEESKFQDQFSQMREPRWIFSQHEFGEFSNVDRSIKLNAITEKVLGSFRIERVACLHQCGDRRASGNGHDAGQHIEGKVPSFNLK